MSTEGTRYPLNPGASLTPCDVPLCHGGKVRAATIEDVDGLRCERCKGTGCLGVTIDVWPGTVLSNRWYGAVTDTESSIFLQVGADTTDEVLQVARRAFGERAL